jgi:outer membrane protein OmpA-like peptidoglycan-associated protein
MTTEYDETDEAGRYPLLDELMDEADETSGEAGEYPGPFEASGEADEAPPFETFNVAAEAGEQFEAPAGRGAAASGLAKPCADCPPGAACEVLDRFAFDRDGLTAGHAARVKAIAARVAASHRAGAPILGVRVVGHTDPVGSDAYNLDLGKRRARAVAEALAKELRGKITRSMVFQVGSRGESRLISSDAARNRRVEICLITAAVPPPPPPPRPRRCDRQELDRLNRECDLTMVKCLLKCKLSAVLARIKQIPALAPCARLRDPRAIILCALARGGKKFIDNLLDAKKCADRCQSNRGLCRTNALSGSGCVQTA